MEITIKNKLIRIILTSFMLATMIISVPLVTQNGLGSANASDITCAGSGACTSTVGGAIVSGGTGTGSLPGAGSGGGPVAIGPGGVVAAPMPQSWAPDGTTHYDQYSYRVTFTPRGKIGDFEPCATKNVGGVEIKASGKVQTDRKTLRNWYESWDGGSGYNWYPQYSDWEIMSKTCVYPPVTVAPVTKTCLVNYSATVDRLSQSYLGGANGVMRTSGTITSIASLENGGLGNCKQNANVGLAYSPPNGQNGWGQYRASSLVGQVTCTFVTTTFDGASDHVGKCGGVSQVSGTVGKLTVWCDGYANGWLVKDWTGTDCRNSKSHPLVCSIPNAATYNGYSGNVQGIRDGKDSPVKWGTPKVTGGWGMTNWRSSTVVNAGSSPRNTAVNDNSETKQLFDSSLNFSSGMTAGQNLNQNLAFYSAGDAGSPFSMTRNYLYDTWFTASHTNMTSIDLRSGKISTSSYNESAFAKNNKCGPQVSPKIDVIRAIGDTVK